MDISGSSDHTTTKGDDSLKDESVNVPQNPNSERTRPARACTKNNPPIREENDPDDKPASKTARRNKEDDDPEWCKGANSHSQPKPKATKRKSTVSNTNQRGESFQNSDLNQEDDTGLSGSIRQSEDLLLRSSESQTKVRLDDSLQFVRDNEAYQDTVEGLKAQITKEKILTEAQKTIIRKLKAQSLERFQRDEVYSEANHILSLGAQEIFSRAKAWARSHAVLGWTSILTENRGTCNKLLQSFFDTPNASKKSLAAFKSRYIPPSIVVNTIINRILVDGIMSGPLSYLESDEKIGMASQAFLEGIVEMFVSREEGYKGMAALSRAIDPPYCKPASRPDKLRRNETNKLKLQHSKRTTMKILDVSSLLLRSSAGDHEDQARCTELHKIVTDALHFRCKLSAQNPHADFRLWGDLPSLKFSLQNSFLEPHRALKLDTEESRDTNETDEETKERRDFFSGKFVDIVVEPLIMLWGNHYGERYDEYRVIHKAVVYMVGDPSQKKSNSKTSSKPRFKGQTRSMKSPSDGQNTMEETAELKKKTSSRSTSPAQAQENGKACGRPVASQQQSADGESQVGIQHSPIQYQTVIDLENSQTAKPDDPATTDVKDIPALSDGGQARDHRSTNAALPPADESKMKRGKRGHKTFSQDSENKGIPKHNNEKTAEDSQNKRIKVNHDSHKQLPTSDPLPTKNFEAGVADPSITSSTSFKHVESLQFQAAFNSDSNSSQDPQTALPNKSDMSVSAELRGFVGNICSLSRHEL